jgi:rubrerythrin
MKIPEGESYQLLKEKATIGEILETASNFEQAAFNFYNELQYKVSKPLRILVQELAEEEQRHFELFQELKNKPEISEQIKQRIQKPANDHHFSDYILLPKIDDFLDDQALIQYALGREQAAMEQYRSLANETPAGPIQDLFRYLANEELEHKNELEKRYYELVHSGGV